MAPTVFSTYSSMWPQDFDEVCRGRWAAAAGHQRDKSGDRVLPHQQGNSKRIGTMDDITKP